MTTVTRADPALHAFLAAVFERSPRRSLIELRWPVGERMHRSFHAPAELDALEQSALDLATCRDVYFGVLPRWREGGRRRDLCGAPRVVWADCDGPRSVDALRDFRIPPSIILRSGTSENCHAFWLLSHSETIASIERANRRLAAQLGADDGVVTSASAILRLPDTLNHKHSLPAPVTLDIFEPDRRYPLAKIVRDLPADPIRPHHGRRRRRRADDPLLALPPAFYVWRLIGKRVGRSRKLCCPLHDEQRASFHVYPDPERGWYCFGCRRGGTVYDLAAALWLTGQSVDTPLRGRDFIVVRGRLMAILLSENADV